MLNAKTLIFDIIYCVWIVRFFFYIWDFFYLSRRKNLTNSFRYTPISLSSNLYLSFARLALILLWGFSYKWIYDQASHSSLNLIPENWPVGIQFAIAFLCGDFCYYVSHRLSHQVQALWVVHAVHHQDTQFNFSTSLRFSDLGSFVIAPFLAVPLLFGVNTGLLFAALILNLSLMSWVHSSIGKLPNWIEFILNTPSHHRKHHAYGTRSGLCNYGSFLIIWDRMFGTFKKEEKLTVRFGVRDTATANRPMTHQVQGIFGLFRKYHSERDTNPLFNSYLFFPINFVAFSFFFPIAYGGRNHLAEALVLILILISIELYPRANQVMRSMLWVTWAIASLWSVQTSYNILLDLKYSRLVPHLGLLLSMVFLIILNYQYQKKDTQLSESENQLETHGKTDFSSKAS